MDEEIDKNVLEIGIAGCRRQLRALKETQRVQVEAMTPQEQEDYYKLIDSYKEFSGDECLINFMLYAKNPA